MDSTSENDANNNTNTESKLNNIIRHKEVQKAIKMLKLNKASGPDKIPTKALKHGGIELCKQTTAILNTVYNNDKLKAANININLKPSKYLVDTPEKDHTDSAMNIKIKLLKTQQSMVKNKVCLKCLFVLLCITILHK